MLNLSQHLILDQQIPKQVRNNFPTLDLTQR
jgi:hypothetical protein